MEKLEIIKLISKNINDLNLENDILNKKFSIYHDKYVFAIYFIKLCLKDIAKIENNILIFYNKKNDIWEKYSKSIELKYVHRIIREFIPNSIKEEIISKINLIEFMNNIRKKYNNDIEDNKGGDINTLIMKILDIFSKLNINNFLIKLKKHN